MKRIYSRPTATIYKVQPHAMFAGSGLTPGGETTPSGGGLGNNGDDNETKVSSIWDNFDDEEDKDK